MKKSAFLLLLLTPALALTSCADSDDNEPMNPAEEVAGIYEGHTVASCAYFSGQIAPDQTVTVTPTEGGRVKVGFASSSWGTVTIPGATVTAAGNGYAIEGTGISVMGMEGSESKDYVCNLAGRIADGEAGLTFTCPAVMGGLTIEFKSGPAPQE